MNRTQKTDEVVKLRERFDRMINAVFTDFRGLDVETITGLRRQFRKAQIEFKVVKNTLVKRALSDLPYSKDLDGHLTEMTAIAWSYEDPTASAKVIRDFVKGNDKLKVKCGVMDGRVMSIEGWAEMPSRDQLLASLVGALESAPQSLMMQMIGPAQDLISLIDAQRENLEKQQQGASE